MSKITELYQSVTSDIIAELEAGALPWVKPWSNGRTVGLMPTNAATGRAYSGINIPLLWRAADVHGYPTHGWMTFRQAAVLSAHVRKGERGSEVIFVKRIPIERTEEEEQAMIPLLRTYIVFNVAQIDGLAEPAPANPPATTAEVDAFIAATGADIRFGGNVSAYFPRPDVIAMPPIAAFTDTAGFYATVLHELGHWTGHPTRLHRELSHRFGTGAYAAEELIAELIAAFLCAQLGIRGELRHAGYIADWISLLKVDNRALFTAASQASRAAEYLHRLARPAEGLDVA